MTRDWDLVREVLTEVEAIPLEERHRFAFTSEADLLKTEHALLLLKAGFIEGSVIRPMSGQTHLLRPSLTWQGHELLDTIRSKTVWERIKSLAAEKGLELTFDSIKLLGGVALKMLVGS
jgi:hypothetical protein